MDAGSGEEAGRGLSCLAGLSCLTSAAPACARRHMEHAQCGSWDAEAAFPRVFNMHLNSRGHLRPAAGALGSRVTEPLPFCVFTRPLRERGLIGDAAIGAHICRRTRHASSLSVGPAHAPRGIAAPRGRLQARVVGAQRVDREPGVPARARERALWCRPHGRFREWREPLHSSRLFCHSLEGLTVRAWGRSGAVQRPRTLCAMQDAVPGGDAVKAQGTPGALTGVRPGTNGLRTGCGLLGPSGQRGAERTVLRRLGPAWVLN